MIERIKVNLEAVEAMLYFWQATNDRENVSEMFIYDVADMQGLIYAYDEEFTAETVRRALSALKNREKFTSVNRKEGRFYNNNLWMKEDLEYTNMMVQPVKKLNLDGIVKELKKLENNRTYEELEVIFVPLHMEEYIIVENKLIVNFFKVKPSDVDDTASIEGKELTQYIREKLELLLVK